MKKISATFFNSCFLFLFLYCSSATDTITLSQSIADGNGSRTLVSKDGKFELGFFSPASSRNRYVGIWYKVDSTAVVWVANRENPINDSSGVLMMKETGNLLLVATNKTVVWSSNVTKTAQNPIAQLLDSGNLVIKEAKDSDFANTLWESFDYPSDTLLPEMKLGRNMITGLDRRLSSWKSSVDPSPGDFTYGLEEYDFPQLVIRRGFNKFFRSGPWQRLGFSGVAPFHVNEMTSPSIVSNDKEVYYIFSMKNKSTVIRIVLNQSSNSRQSYAWSSESKTWTLYAYLPTDLCDNYGICGPYGYCTVNRSPVCQCLKGFGSASPENWNSAIWSEGCVRNNPICQDGDGFVKFGGLKLPDTGNSWVNSSMNLKECRAKCLQNCSCMAYTNLDIRGKGSGCALWLGNLTDMKQSELGQDLYIRMSASDLEAEIGAKVKIPVIIAATIAVAFGILILSYYVWKCRSKSKEKKEENKENGELENAEQQEDLELPLLDLTAIASATNNFSNDNKLGEGGFGPVYKGTLLDGQEIAVKRLSKCSGQGLKEFKNEVILIAKLQHRNLVKLIGCCIQEDEKLLIYEYMPNKSLDTFIFEETRGKLLDWSKRFNIICGIARGLLYLHQDSRLRIVHRDLKTSNILLDEDMNPKISDFGMAKTFGGDQTEGNTNRVVGTYGYMAPEYATDGLFSVKSDVFSFGVLVLEIISGKKSRGFCHPSKGLNLIGHAWKLWKEGKPVELIDNNIAETRNISEIMRCIQISLLCVQQHPEERPSVASVVMMLGSESDLPQPKQPGFFKDRGPAEVYSRESSSTNEMSISLLTPR